MTSLSRRFNAVFVLLVAVPIVAVCLLLSWLYVNALLDVATVQTEELGGQVAQNVGGEIDRVSIFAAALLYDRELQAATVQYMERGGEPQRTSVARLITERLSSALTYTNRIGAIVLYMNDGNTLSFNNYPNIRDFGRPDDPAFAQAKAAPGTVVVADGLSGVGGNVGERFIISAMVCPAGRDGPSGVAAMLVMFRIPYLDQLASTDSARSGNGILVYGRDGRVILSSLRAVPSASDGRRFWGRGGVDRDFRLDGRTYLVVSRPVESAGWTVLSLVDKAAITSRVTAYQWYVYPALLVILGLFFAYEMTFFARIARPIHSLSATMALVGQGGDPAAPGGTGIAELDQLVASFNRMVAEIGRLNREREQRERKRLATEIAALQFQINPHFMANTLNSIRFMAIASNNDAIRDMAQALIRIVADSYSIDAALARLDAEVENVRSYVHIMQVRFGERIRVDYDIDPAAAGLGVLRMMLQPVVENAILHGLAGLDRQGVVAVAARVGADGCLAVEVRDNGRGMSAERLAAVRAAELDAGLGGGAGGAGGDVSGGEGEAGAESGGQGESGGAGESDGLAGGHFNRIGIRNVQERIRLRFGPGYGLDIASRPGVGTTVAFRLPALPAPEPCAAKPGAAEPGTATEGGRA